MAITVNGDNHPWRKGLTVEKLLEEKKFSFPLKNVFINGVRVPKQDHPTRLIDDGDEVNVVHLMGGG
jgi:thiamine biosynthesis protein ThiS